MQRKKKATHSTKKPEHIKKASKIEKWGTHKTKIERKMKWDSWIVFLLVIFVDGEISFLLRCIIPYSILPEVLMKFEMHTIKIPLSCYRFASNSIILLDVIFGNKISTSYGWSILMEVKKKGVLLNENRIIFHNAIVLWS